MKTLSDKVILITGSTDGLGKLAAQRFASRGATVLLHGRDISKGKETIAGIRRATGNDRLEYFNADLASLEKVRSMAKAVLSKHDTLHLLINNAGLGGGPKGNGKRELSRDGYELRFQVNYLSHFLLTYMVVVNCLHPATLMNTNMVYEFFGSTMSSVEEGADALEYVATSDETANVTGEYFDQKRRTKANAEARRRLRDISFELTGLAGTRPD